MGIQAPAEVKFALIYEAIRQDDNVLSISYMCQIAGVSRSGFYAWINATPARKKRDDTDKADFEKVLEAFRFRGYAKGARSIHMRAPASGYHHECQEDSQTDEEISSFLFNPQSEPVPAYGKESGYKQHCRKHR